MLNSKLNLIAVTALLLIGVTLVSAQKPTPLLTQPADKLIAVLKSDAPQKEKADACRQLAVIGGKDAVPALAALLADEKMTHMARYALETIPDPSVDDALRAALDQLKGRPLVGVIGSIGVRRDAKAVKPLAKLLRDRDADVAQAAARALGKIGTVEAAKAIRSDLSRTPRGNQVAFCEGLFRCAETLAVKGERKEALKIYDQLRGLKKAPHQVRAGALRGAILTDEKDGIKLLVKALRSDDFILVDAAARTAMEMPGADVTPALTKEYPKLNPDKKILLIQTFGQRADAEALPTLLGAAKSGAKTVRLAAIRALPMLGQSQAAIVLMSLLSDTDREIAQAAQESLAALPGEEIDNAVMTMLRTGNTDLRLVALELIARRRMTGAVPALLKMASDGDAKVRPAALKRVGELAGPGELPALLEALDKAKSAQEIEAIEQALSSVCSKAEKPEACVEKLVSSMAQAQPAQKSALVRVLSAIGGSAALKAVRDAVNDPNTEVHGAAVRALGSWKTADAAPALLELAQNAGNPTERMLCLRSYLGLAAQPELPAAERLAMCQKAAASIQKDDEKKLLLGTLGGISTLKSLSVILPYLEEAGVRDEAAAAALAIADKLLQGRNAAKQAPSLLEPLQKVAKATANTDLAKRAQTLLEQARSKGAGK